MSQSIKVFAPATVANVTCGFDILGFAVHQPGDELLLEIRDQPGLEIKDIQGDQGLLPRDPQKNTVSVAIAHLLDHLKLDCGFNLYLQKKMPLGSGLGSSAASAVAGVFGANLLLGKPLETLELLPFAMQGEALACGSAHADNVAPALLGGFVLIRSYQPLDVVKIPSPSELYAAVLHPQIDIATKDARSILKKQVPMKSAIQQWGNVAGLVTGLITENYPLIGRSMEDVVVEPVRSMLIPGFQEVKRAALDAGALGCGISGSGPSMFALSVGQEVAQSVGEAMTSALQKVDIGSDLFVSAVNQNGPLILSQDAAP
ncbi:MAG: homoserine kinase [Cyclobacteriaceae bacterium]|nr:homoserine kinase [Cyclobacteriaceae bacterium]